MFCDPSIFLPVMFNVIICVLCWLRFCSIHFFFNILIIFYGGISLDFFEYNFLIESHLEFALAYCECSCWSSRFDRTIFGYLPYFRHRLTSTPGCRYSLELFIINRFNQPVDGKRNDRTGSIGRYPTPFSFCVSVLFVTSNKKQLQQAEFWIIRLCSDVKGMCEFGSKSCFERKEKSRTHFMSYGWLIIEANLTEKIWMSGDKHIA